MDFPDLPEGFSVATEPQASTESQSDFPALPEGFSSVEQPKEEFDTIPKKIAKFKALGLSDEDALSQAKKESFQARGVPDATTSAQFEEHVSKPFKEGLATIGAGFASIVDDVSRAVGLGSKDLHTSLEEAKAKLKADEKYYEDKYGLDVVRETTKALPQVLTGLYNYSNLWKLAATEAPMAYGMTRAEGGTVGEAAVSGAVATAIPAAIGLAGTIGKVITYPARKKSELLQQVDQAAKADMLDILRYAEDKGITLTPAQLVNNSTIEQLTDVVARNPTLKAKFDAVSEQNKAILLEAYVNLKNSMSKADVSRSFVNGEADPFGKEVQRTLKEALSVRKERIKEAYNLFDDLASEVKIGTENLKSLSSRLKDIKSIAEDTNDPQAFMNIVNSALKRVKTPEQIPGEVEKSIHDMLTMKKVATNDVGEFRDLSLKDLNTISKQLYKLSEGVDDPTLKMAWTQTRGAVNDTIAAVAREDEALMSTLEIAKRRHIEKEALYGLHPDYKAIAKTVNETNTDEIVSNLLQGKGARTNAIKLKQEFELAGKPEMSQALAKRYMEDAFQASLHEVKDIGQVDVKDFISAYKRIDPEVVKFLAGEEKAREFKILAHIAKSSEKLDQLTSVQPLINRFELSYVKNLAESYVQGRLIGQVLTSDIAQKNMIKLLTQKVKPEEANKLAREAAKAVNLSDEIFKHEPASKVLGDKPLEIYRAGDTAVSEASGPLGKGTYYFTEEAKAIERQAGTTKKIFKEKINPSDLATMDTVTKIVGRPAKYADLKESMIKDLKLRGFKGIYDNGEMVIFK